MEFSRQDYWSRFPFPSPGDLPDLWLEPWSLTLQADSFTVWAPGYLSSIFFFFPLMNYFPSFILFLLSGIKDKYFSLHVTIGDLGSIPGLGRSPGEGKGDLPTPVFWPGEFHGLYSPWGHKESDTTKWLSLHFSCHHMSEIILDSLGPPRRILL